MNGSADVAYCNSLTRRLQSMEAAKEDEWAALSDDAKQYEVRACGLRRRCRPLATSRQEKSLVNDSCCCLLLLFAGGHSTMQAVIASAYALVYTIGWWMMLIIAYWPHHFFLH